MEARWRYADALMRAQAHRRTAMGAELPGCLARVMRVFAALLLFVAGAACAGGARYSSDGSPHDRAAPTPIGSLAGLWRSQTMMDDWMEPPYDAGWLRLRSHWPAVPQWQWPSRYNKTDPFTAEMCTDGLLGGWNNGSITGGGQSTG